MGRRSQFSFVLAVKSMKIGFRKWTCGTPPRPLATFGGVQAMRPEALSSEPELRQSASDMVMAGSCHPFARTLAAGGDPLGDAFCRIRSAAERRPFGQTFTPPSIVQAMFSRAREQSTDYSLIVDPGAGTGRFTMAAAAAFPNARLLAVEPDPLCAFLLKANASSLGFLDRLEIVQADFRSIRLPLRWGSTLFIGNPPFVRHHDIAPEWKDWYARKVADLGCANASKLAGMHLHFFVAACLLAQPGDFGIFVTAAEWMSSGYGHALRQLLCGVMGGLSVHEIDCKSAPFPGTLATAAITAFTPGGRHQELILGKVASALALGSLRGGVAHKREVLQGRARWDIDGEPSGSASLRTSKVGDFFRVSRGAVTGANRVWVAGEHAAKLPSRFLLPCVTAARDLFSRYDAGHQLETECGLLRVVSLPVSLLDLPAEEQVAVEEFLRWAQVQGADTSYVARHRAAWWSVVLPPAPPIICTYMARRPPVFLRNHIGARLLNIAHGLYPRHPMTAEQLNLACRLLNEGSSLEQGRSYAGGLMKFEPGTVEAMPFDVSTFEADLS